LALAVDAVAWWARSPAAYPVPPRAAKRATQATIIAGLGSFGFDIGTSGA
jgi:uncharacterized iron-regulated membrane protein